MTMSATEDCRVYNHCILKLVRLELFFFLQVVFMYNVVCDFKIVMEPQSHRANQCTQKDHETLLTHKNILVPLYIFQFHQNVLHLDVKRQ